MNCVRTRILECMLKTCHRLCVKVWKKLSKSCLSGTRTEKSGMYVTHDVLWVQDIGLSSWWSAVQMDCFTKTFLPIGHMQGDFYFQLECFDMRDAVVWHHHLACQLFVAISGKQVIPQIVSCRCSTFCRGAQNLHYFTAVLAPPTSSLCVLSSLLLLFHWQWPIF